MARERRKPGGQPGNSNRLKHGFYSASFGDSLRLALKEAAALGVADLEAELAAARTILRRLIEASPDNIDAIARLLNTITNLASTNYRLSAADSQELEATMVDELERLRAEVFA